MQRDFGDEIVRTFGARLKRIYESEDQRLPSQMLTCLEQLRHAERGVSVDTTSQPNADDDAKSRFDVPSATR